MRIVTERLILRRFRMEDQQAFNELIRDKMASPYAAYDHDFPVDDEGLSDVLSFFSQTPAFIAVTLAADGTLIGLVTLHPAEKEDVREIGYCMHSRHQRQGYAREAAQALMAYAQEALGARTLICGTAKCNEPSVRLLEKLGFTVTAEGPAAFKLDEKGEPIAFDALMFEKVL